MLASPDSTISNMVSAVATTVHALAAASQLDVDRSAADKKFFAAEQKPLATILKQLVSAKRAIEDYDLEDGSLCQAFVEIGDVVLDRGVSAGNTRTKLGLQGQTGLDASHVFGSNVSTLTRAPIAAEPEKVIEAMARMKDLPAFKEKNGIVGDLTKRANQQQQCLDDRDKGDAKRAKLVSAGVKLVVDAAHALAKCKADLDGRFTRQRDYVAAFFLDTAPRRAAKPAPASGDGAAPGAGGDLLAAAAQTPTLGKAPRA